MGYCKHCGDAVHADVVYCHCGGRQVDSLSHSILEPNVKKDKWGSRYLLNSVATTEMEPIYTSTALARNRSGSKVDPLKAMTAQFGLSNESVAEDCRELSVFGNLLDPNDHWACCECQKKFKSEATVYPHPDAKKDKNLEKTFYCRECFGKHHSKGRCKRCKAAVLTDASFITHKDLLWHDTCYICSYCSVPSVPSDILIDLAGAPACETCFFSEAYLRHGVPPSPHLSRTHSQSQPAVLAPVRSKYGSAPATPDYVPGANSIIIKKEAPMKLGAQTGNRVGWNVKDDREKSPMVKTYNELGDKMRSAGLKSNMTLPLELKLENKIKSTVRAPVDYGRRSNTFISQNSTALAHPPFTKTSIEEPEEYFAVPAIPVRKIPVRSTLPSIPVSNSLPTPSNNYTRVRTWSTKSNETRPASPAPITLPGGSTSPVKNSPFRQGHTKPFSIPKIPTKIFDSPTQTTEKQLEPVKPVNLPIEKRQFKPPTVTTPSIALPTPPMTRPAHIKSHSLQVGLSLAERGQIFGLASPATGPPMSDSPRYKLSLTRTPILRPQSAQSFVSPIWKDVKLRPISPLKLGITGTGSALTPRVPMESSGGWKEKKSWDVKSKMEPIRFEKNITSMNAITSVGVNPNLTQIKSTYEIKAIESNQLPFRNPSPLPIVSVKQEEDLEICNICKKALGFGELIELIKTKEAFHRECFKCAGNCGRRLEAGTLYPGDGGYFHKECRPAQEVTRFRIPVEPIPTSTPPPVRSKPVEQLACRNCGVTFKLSIAGDDQDDKIISTRSGSNFHVNCVTCTTCAGKFENKRFVEMSGLPFHEECLPKIPAVSPFSGKKLPTLPSSKRVAVPALQISTPSTKKVLIPSTSTIPRCVGCTFQILNEFSEVSIQGKSFHRTCLTCWKCKKTVPAKNAKLDGDKLVCEAHQTDKVSKGRIEAARVKFSNA